MKDRILWKVKEALFILGIISLPTVFVAGGGSWLSLGWGMASMFLLCGVGERIENGINTENLKRSKPARF